MVIILQKNHNISFLNKVALLSISFFMISAYAIASAIPEMQQYFSNQSTTQIQLLSTTPAAAVISVILFTNRITNVIGTKRTVQLGLIMTATFGALPIILDNYYLILISRFMMGIGLGLCNSLAVSLIGDFFEGKEKATMLGLRSATENIGQTLLFLAVGYLIAFGGWRLSFSIYLLALVVFILVTYFLPSVDENKHRLHQASSSKFTINSHLFFYAISTFISGTFFIAMMVTIPLLINNNGFGSEESGQILSVIAFVGMLIGIVFGKIYHILGKSVLLCASICMIIGSFVLVFSSSYAMLVLGAIIFGVSFPLFIIGALNYLHLFTPKEAEVQSISILIFSVNLGGFLAPYNLRILEFFSLAIYPELENANLGIFSIFSLILFMLGTISYFNLKVLEKRA